MDGAVRSEHRAALQALATDLSRGADIKRLKGAGLDCGGLPPNNDGHFNHGQLRGQSMRVTRVWGALGARRRSGTWRAARRLSLVALASVGLMGALPFAAEEPLGIAYFSGSARSKIGALMMVEVYRRAGINTKAVSMPGARNAPSSEASVVYGESVRVASYTDAHPTLTRVEPAVTVWTTVAFYKEFSRAKVSTVEDLRKYKVGYVRGTRSAEDVIAALGLTEVEGAVAPDMLFRMLSAGRFDVAIDGGTNGNFWIRKYGLQSIAQYEINRIPLYHILSPKYKELAPKLAAVIKAMQASGELAQLEAWAEKQVVESDVD
jgi:ABC-type amino acid transport substrate-binding protein